MVKKDSAWLKTERLKIIARSLATMITQNKKVDYEHFITLIEYEHGLTRKKAKYYIDLICKTHDWEIEYEGDIQFIKVITE